MSERSPCMAWGLGQHRTDRQLQSLPLRSLDRDGQDGGGAKHALCRLGQQSQVMPSPDSVEPAFYLRHHLLGRCRTGFQFGQVAGCFGSLAIGMQGFAAQPMPAGVSSLVLGAAQPLCAALRHLFGHGRQRDGVQVGHALCQWLQAEQESRSQGRDVLHQGCRQGPSPPLQAAIQLVALRLRRLVTGQYWRILARLSKLRQQSALDVQITYRCCGPANLLELAQGLLHLPAQG